MYNNIALLIGHLIGDYLFQNEAMVLQKTKPGFDGIVSCMTHCIVYSWCVAICVILGGWRYLNFDWYHSSFVVWMIAFISHYPFDRVSFAWKWMRWIRQTQFKDYDGTCDSIYEKVIINKRNYFVAPIYIAVDNTIHLVLMWILLSVIGKGGW